MKSVKPRAFGEGVAAVGHAALSEGGHLLLRPSEFGASHFSSCLSLRLWRSLPFLFIRVLFLFLSVLFVSSDFIFC